MSLTRAEQQQRAIAKRAHKAACVMRAHMRLVAKNKQGETTHRNNHGKSIEFVDHYFMIQIYKEFAPYVVLMSSVQTGKTEYLISYTMACILEGLDVFYVLPKYELRNTFVANRIDPLIEDVPTYAKILKRNISKRSAADNKTLKQFIKAVIKFVSSNVRADFKEFPADVRVGDEVEEFDLENYSMADDRLENSPYKFVREASNPTVEDHCIHEKFKYGKQYEMHFRCTGCGKWQILDFFQCVCKEIHDSSGNVIDHVLREDVDQHDEFVCSVCNCALDRSQWRWIPLHSQGKYPSYHISKLMVRSASPKQLWDQFLVAKRKGATELTRFHNSVLGIPYSPAGSRVTDAMLQSASLMKWQPDQLPEKEYATMGVDVGSFLDVRLSIHRNDLRLCIHLGRYKTFEELHDLIARFRVRCCVIDAQPEERQAKQFQEDAKCDVWLCRFKKYEGEGSRINRDEKNREVSVDRTYILDMATQQIMDRTNVLPIDSATALDGFYKKSMLANKRVLRFDARGNARYVWTKETNDHQRFADVYDLIATHLWGSPAESVDPDEHEEGDELKRGGFQSNAWKRDFLAVEDGEREVVEEPDEEDGDDVVEVQQDSPLRRGHFGKGR